MKKRTTGPTECCAEDLDAKECVLRWVDCGQLLIARPLREQLHVALEQVGFRDVRIDRERVHDVYLVRMSLGLNMDCTTPRIALQYFRRMARSLGKTLVRGVVHPTVQGGRVRAALLFTDAAPVDLDPMHLR
jgi:hypothetical protein